ncbi:chorismate mutase [Marinicellulosiphila megalodicopiae]|uniref:chorismate mutase n=1 Tax=Marinicellulosiphila megalodicopiae TaxID=2724896 RepID=UPI003BB1F9F6
MESLDQLRDRIDKIDADIFSLIAERFEITNQVGIYKAMHQLPAKDELRELKQYERISALAEQFELDPQMAKDFLAVIIDKVVENHIDIAEQIE